MAKQVLLMMRLLLIFPRIGMKAKYVKEDLYRWIEVHNLTGNKYRSLAYIMWYYPEFRNLFIYRNSNKLLYRHWVALWYKPMDTLYIQAKEIGGGLYIQHGFATIIAAERIGENCWINQQVTVGYKGNGRPPIIGNNVMITCGAKVLGAVTIGDNAVIGANAVVVSDVAAGAVMGGIPAKRIK